VAKYAHPEAAKPMQNEYMRIAIRNCDKSTKTPRDSRNNFIERKILPVNDILNNLRRFKSDTAPEQLAPVPAEKVQPIEALTMNGTLARAPDNTTKGVVTGVSFNPLPVSDSSEMSILAAAMQLKYCWHRSSSRMKKMSAANSLALSPYTKVFVWLPQFKSIIANLIGVKINVKVPKQNRITSHAI